MVLAWDKEEQGASHVAIIRWRLSSWDISVVVASHACCDSSSALGYNIIARRSLGEVWLKFARSKEIIIILIITIGSKGRKSIIPYSNEAACSQEMKAAISKLDANLIIS